MTIEPSIPPPGGIVIGASMGAIEALSEILPVLPEGYPLPVLVVVHVARDRKSGLPELFANRCRIPVKEAEDKEPIQGGVIYFAPPDYHLLVENDFSLSLSNEEPVLYSRPAIDVLFDSAADAYGDRLVGIVLTGASTDGAKGLRAICLAGGKALVQDPETAAGQTMPLAALDLCPDARSLRLDEIAAILSADIVDILK
ncbi:chemotaxis protein CheB [Luteolibacter pohnpeiensis]|uniref:protein-glutamate methylesterase n=1 Tax=Luteolibacter pohnpeiensis TaxID=454153 RepID=A0A934S6K2_9BACT|nr:chemotaxis protein CheB [Luteolibacter pohnpeiensis]MBK1882195.1 chemotaxis protein CheB [Luteolibacter pohnpeiensis]